MIRTTRLCLIPATVELLKAELQGRTELERALGIAVPKTWPPELHEEEGLTFTIRQLERHPDHAGWWMYYIAQCGADGNPHTLVGTGGYKGPPDADGTVEVGYTVLAAYRRRGYASEATRGWVDHAFAQADVTRVIAETLPELYPSIGVLKKCGFAFAGTGSEEGVIRYELTRASYERLPPSLPSLQRNTHVHLQQER